MSDPIDPGIAAQLRQLDPDREEVVTWHRFRVGCFRQKDPATGEETARVLEFRRMDGTEVHQFVLTDEIRQQVAEWLSAEGVPSGLVLPS